ncbi:hypothetical protein F3Y22_tig00116944pilonHSYRG00067 [Hibiscus syriacus]|uniref:Diacylglycerol O-acyltransferase n=1 Tax=Hibiscus syriacus TaxID=106335 RepID=A0A6A2WYW4_HIBSY|nr:hypothetical protein F3Y22_tig00116944pilonHSYRG00067 [Hibiscus syriacus]
MVKDLHAEEDDEYSEPVNDQNGVKQWKKVEVKLEDHVNIPVFPPGLSPESYDSRLRDYLSNITMEQLPHNRPLRNIHIIKYTTSNAAGNLIFKLHHSLRDGHSLMGALLSCFQRADTPSVPLTFPSRGSTPTTTFSREQQHAHKNSQTFTVSFQHCIGFRVKPVEKHLR